MRQKKPLRSAALAGLLLVAYLSVGTAAALTAQVSPEILPKGSSLYISGETDYPGEIAVWILGREYSERICVPAPEREYSTRLIDEKISAELRSGQYFVIAEDRGPDWEFDLEERINLSTGAFEAVAGGQILFSDEGDEFQYVSRAVAFFEALGQPEVKDSPKIDDRTAMTMFLVEEPWIRCGNFRPGQPGEILQMTGSTNLPVGENISWSVEPAEAGEEGQRPLEIFSGTTVVYSGANHNSWTISLNTAGWEEGEYILFLTTPRDTGAAGLFMLSGESAGTDTSSPITVETLQEGPEMVDGVTVPSSEESPEPPAYGEITCSEDLIRKTDAEIGPSAIEDDYIVWTETEDLMTSVYLYTISSGETREILTDADYRISSLDLSSGRIAWVPRRTYASSSRIAVYEIEEGSIEEICICRGCMIDEIALDGGMIAWSGNDPSFNTENLEPDIFLFDLTTRNNTAICLEPGAQHGPAIGEGYIAWRSQREGKGEEMMMYSLKDGIQTPFCPSHKGSFGTPFLDSGVICAPLHYYLTEDWEAPWRDLSTPYNTDIAIGDLSAGTTELLPLPQNYLRFSPESNGGWIVWEEKESEDGSSTVVLYDIKTGTKVMPLDDSRSLHNPSIDGNHYIATEEYASREGASLWLAVFEAGGRYSPAEGTKPGKRSEETKSLPSGSSAATAFGCAVMGGGAFLAYLYRRGEE